MSNPTYAAIRALNALDEKRSDPSYPGDTAMLPALKMPEGDDTVPMLPAFLRPQAE